MVIQGYKMTPSCLRRCQMSEVSVMCDTPLRLFPLPSVTHRVIVYAVVTGPLPLRPPLHCTTCRRLYLTIVVLHVESGV